MIASTVAQSLVTASTAVQDLGLVHLVARRFQHRCGRLLDYDDLVDWGWIALYRARQLYDPTRGAAWPTYAVASIQGFLKQQLQAWYEGEAPVSLEHSGAAYGGWGDDDAIPLTDTLADASATDPCEAAAEADLRRCVRRAVDQLPAPLCQAATLYYVHGHQQTQVAREIGVSQSQVSRRLQAAARLLRRLLEEAGAGYTASTGTQPPQVHKSTTPQIHHYTTTQVHGATAPQVHHSTSP